MITLSTKKQLKLEVLGASPIHWEITSISRGSERIAEGRARLFAGPASPIITLKEGQ